MRHLHVTAAQAIRGLVSPRRAAAAALALAYLIACSPAVAAAPALSRLAFPGCPGRTTIPVAVYMHALAHADHVSGYGLRCNPNVPFNPVSNPFRSSLQLANPNLTYHPLFNSVVWRCGCR
ncbi:MAG: hypothetical protein U0470_10085 [Anaerolineae bacterium]